jgi:hypothetical protein
MTRLDHQIGVHHIGVTTVLTGSAAETYGFKGVNGPPDDPRDLGDMFRREL